MQIEYIEINCYQNNHYNKLYRNFSRKCIIIIIYLMGKNFEAFRICVNYYYDIKHLNSQSFIQFFYSKKFRITFYFYNITVFLNQFVHIFLIISN